MGLPNSKPKAKRNRTHKDQLSNFIILADPEDRTRKISSNIVSSPTPVLLNQLLQTHKTFPKISELKVVEGASKKCKRNICVCNFYLTLSDRDTHKKTPSRRFSRVLKNFALKDMSNELSSDTTPSKSKDSEACACLADQASLSSKKSSCSKTSRASKASCATCSAPLDCEKLMHSEIIGSVDNFRAKPPTSYDAQNFQNGGSSASKQLRGKNSRTWSRLNGNPDTLGEISAPAKPASLQGMDRPSLSVIIPDTYRGTREFSLFENYKPLTPYRLTKHSEDLPSLSVIFPEENSLQSLPTTNYKVKERKERPKIVVEITDSVIPDNIIKQLLDQGVLVNIKKCSVGSSASEKRFSYSQKKNTPTIDDRNKLVYRAMHDVGQQMSKPTCCYTAQDESTQYQIELPNQTTKASKSTCTCKLKSSPSKASSILSQATNYDDDEVSASGVSVSVVSSDIASCCKYNEGSDTTISSKSTISRRTYADDQSEETNFSGSTLSTVSSIGNLPEKVKRYTDKSDQRKPSSQNNKSKKEKIELSDITEELSQDEFEQTPNYSSKRLPQGSTADKMVQTPSISSCNYGRFKGDPSEKLVYLLSTKYNHQFNTVNQLIEKPPKELIMFMTDGRLPKTSPINTSTDQPLSYYDLLNSLKSGV